MLRVGLKYCGNCNPSFDMPELVEVISERAKWISFVKWDRLDYDLLLVLSSCSRDCASQPVLSCPVVRVTSETVNYWPVSQKELPDRILNVLEQHLTDKYQ